MTPPTAEEIAQAHREVDRDGPQAAATLNLAALVLQNPTLKGILGRMKASPIVNLDPQLAVYADAMLNGAMISGLNLGIRIGEARAKEFAESDVPDFVFCRDCDARTRWHFNQDEIVCEPAHHIVATFSEAAL